MAAAIDNTALRAIFEMTTPAGKFSEGTAKYFADLGQRRPVLLFAFPPKAAGTYFRQAAIEALGGELVRMTHALGGRDATPYLPFFICRYLDKEARPTVAHLHMQALPANRNFIETFGIKPVIMIRSIPDMLASYWDMLIADPVARTEGLNCLIPDGFENMPSEAKADFMIDIIAPWYASYFATWKDFADDAPQTVRVLRYEQLCSDPAKTLHSTLSHTGFSVTYAKCRDAVQKTWEHRSLLRYNKGTAGRSEGYFSPDHIARLTRMISHYPQLTGWTDELLGEVPADSLQAAS